MSEVQWIIVSAVAAATLALSVVVILARAYVDVARAYKNLWAAYRMAGGEVDWLDGDPDDADE